MWFTTATPTDIFYQLSLYWNTKLSDQFLQIVADETFLIVSAVLDNPLWGQPLLDRLSQWGAWLGSSLNWPGPAFAALGCPVYRQWWRNQSLSPGPYIKGMSSRRQKHASQTSFTMIYAHCLYRHVIGMSATACHSSMQMTHFVIENNFL